MTQKKRLLQLHTASHNSLFLKGGGIKGGDPMISYSIYKNGSCIQREKNFLKINFEIIHKIMYNKF